MRIIIIIILPTNRRTRCNRFECVNASTQIQNQKTTLVLFFNLRHLKSLFMNVFTTKQLHRFFSVAEDAIEIPSPWLSCHAKNWPVLQPAVVGNSVFNASKALAYEFEVVKTAVVCFVYRESYCVRCLSVRTDRIFNMM